MLWSARSSEQLTVSRDERSDLSRLSNQKIRHLLEPPRQCTAGTALALPFQEPAKRIGFVHSQISCPNPCGMLVEANSMTRRDAPSRAGTTPACHGGKHVE
jgi:hypothetical protein